MPQWTLKQFAWNSFATSVLRYQFAPSLWFPRYNEEKLAISLNLTKIALAFAVLKIPKVFPSFNYRKLFIRWHWCINWDVPLKTGNCHRLIPRSLAFGGKWMNKQSFQIVSRNHGSLLRRPSFGLFWQRHALYPNETNDTFLSFFS